MFLQLEELGDKSFQKFLVFNALHVGVGGQGVIRATQILAWAAMTENFNVRTAETHGMAQRGGSVSSFLRFGKTVKGPLIPRGEVNVIMALEASEALRYHDYGGKDTVFLVNNYILLPSGIVKKSDNYLKISEIKEFLEKVSNKVAFIDGTTMAEQAGDVRSLNVVMLGVLAGLNLIPLKGSSIKHAIRKFIPSKALTINEKAFDLGFETGKRI